MGLLAFTLLAPVHAAAPSLATFELEALDGTRFDNSQLEGKAVLFVNVASKCGYTPQYEGLQALYEAKKDQGLVIVGVPSNQFGGQEPGSPDQIASFCRINYGVTFPLLAKQDVNGADRSELYAWLVHATDGKNVSWNFEKFLVAPSGEVVGRFPSAVKPQSDTLTKAIDGALRQTKK